MKVIGITGGIGSGKSTVARQFAQSGATVIDMDQIARSLSSPSGAAYDRIVAQFGPSIVENDGTLNRKRIADIVFAEPDQRKKLESILHPLIQQQVKQLIQQSNAQVCIVEIPLLNSRDQFDFIDSIVVVDANPDEQIKRIQVRDSLNKSEIDAIMNAQLDRRARLQLADDVINNTGSLDELAQQVNALIVKYTNNNKSWCVDSWSRQLWQS